MDYNSCYLYGYSALLMLTHGCLVFLLITFDTVSKLGVPSDKIKAEKLLFPVFTNCLMAFDNTI